eukprot:CAMPEP_0175846194 /NCGR_PEP_ID=MMETSP0107_2-20121207/22654_1 /TAXON_ID=195067 ORGANISM="Goniomonas pacifica, Strain CCMP1869" /NCGR_SAMPLE_ID=MMETSP0107_2 /ASSEMBLY_ACC=CAM_ASM_000203 /LENGTH=116 /DNA_ID=CAMNT_0017160855 /DNA_START=157 /DNA_END=508 /DNA_ORIENTATION=+
MAGFADELLGISFLYLRVKPVNSDDAEKLVENLDVPETDPLHPLYVFARTWTPGDLRHIRFKFGTALTESWKNAVHSSKLEAIHWVVEFKKQMAREKHQQRRREARKLTLKMLGDH